MNKFLLLIFIICQLSIVNSQAQTYMNIHLSDGSVTQIDISTIDSITYSVNNPGVLATITTTGVTGISGPSALSGGNITADGGSTISHRGVCWATTSGPTTANDTTLNGTGTGTGSYTSTLTGLSANTTYYVWAYAINSAGTAYGNEVSFTTGDIYTMGSGVTDIDGNFYPSIILGTQEWMQQNLRVTRFANGDTITNESNEITWQTATTGLSASMGNNTSNDIPFGKYYNWYAATDSRNACPTGWHLPAYSEWTTLFDYLGPTHDFPAIGGMMMDSSYYSYSPANPLATNSSGFTAVGANMFDYFAPSSNDFGVWWFSTIFPTNNPNDGNTVVLGIYQILNNAPNLTPTNGFLKTSGVSVRCIKD